jgi:hypothetical protein
MKTLIAMIATLLSTAAYADGFRCLAPGEIAFTVYNHTQAASGTRNGAVMIISDRRPDAQPTTIAIFRSSDNNLTSNGTTYVANVDLRFKSINRNNFFNIQELSTLTLDVDYNYNQPTAPRATVEGTVVYGYRNGTSSEVEVSCVHYFKNKSDI